VLVVAGRATGRRPLTAVRTRHSDPVRKSCGIRAATECARLSAQAPIDTSVAGPRFKATHASWQLLVRAEYEPAACTQGIHKRVPDLTLDLYFEVGESDIRRGAIHASDHLGARARAPVPHALNACIGRLFAPALGQVSQAAGVEAGAAGAIVMHASPSSTVHSSGRAWR